MLCSRCKKRVAVVFKTTIQGTEKHEEGYCLVCAREMGIPQVKEYMDQLGITDEELEEYSDSMTGVMGDDKDGGFFEPGGTNSLPGLIKNLLDGTLGASDMNAQFKNGGQNGESKEGIKTDTQKKDKDKKHKFLNLYCRNLSELAAEGKIDNIVGREKEIARTIQILSRRQKNNPCLIGEPGVGKTAIAEGLALKINSGDVPFHIADKKIYLLDLTSLVAGTQFRGQFESRLKGLLDEITAEGNIILFIDEVHNLVGAGDSDGSMNAANIMKPALSRGEIQVIGATTFTEYRKYIEKDSALERRFQPVKVGEPNIEDTVKILLGIKKYYEDHHKVKVSDEIARSCAVLSERYINDRFLPDKAIDLLDEACACRSIRSAELAEKDRLEKKIQKLEKESDSVSQAAEPDYEEIARIKTELSKAQTDLAEITEKSNALFVDENDLAYVIELWTGIPANKISSSEYKKLGTLEENIKKRIVGQDKAVEDVCKAIRRTRVSLEKRRRPASFIFVGPTGVGKTELVKVISSELFNDADPLIRLDMTEYMEKHSVSKLVGSPPGYVGYDEAGQLTEKVRRKPYSVILFDEIEKAHPDVMNILLQILDEGRITDSQGRSVNFENTIICMTSNAGSSDKSSSLGFNKTEGDISREKVMKALNEFLRPEFLGRIDEVVVFNPLDEEAFGKIAALALNEMKDPMEEKKINFTYDKKACAAIAKKAYGKKFGGRAVRNVIRTDVEDKIASIIIENADNENITDIFVTAENDEIKVDFTKTQNVITETK